MKSFTLKLVTPLKTLFDQPVEEVAIPTSLGEITVLPNHIPLVGVVVPGELRVKSEGQQFPLVVFGGILQFVEGTLTILADAAQHADEIDLDAAEKATAELIAKLEDKAHMDTATYEILVRDLERERMKLRISRKWKKV